MRVGYWVPWIPALVACSPGEESVVPSATTDAWFVDVSEDWGLDFVHDDGATSEKHLPETMGAGAALVDLDGDGDLDLYLVQGGPLPLGESRANAPPNRLFLNDGRGRLRDATDASGDAAHRGYGMGVAAGDANGDGHVDLYVTNLGPDALLAGDGGAHFTDRTASSRLGDPRWTTAALFFDPDEDGDLDLYVTGYVEVDLENPEWCGERQEGWRSYCHPDRYEGLADRFYRNRGDGVFDGRTDEAGLADSTGKGLGAVALDFDDDGHLDLYVANDSVENRLWRGRGDGTFEDATLLSGTGVDGSGATEAGMGVATGDVDGDGRIDLFVTNFDDESNTLYRNDGDGLFTDVTARAGLDAPSRIPVGFGTVAEDLDGDGDLDLAVANGHIVDNIHLYHDGKTHAQHAQLYRNDGTGRFEDVREEAGDLSATPFVGRGLVAGDLDGDGRPDLVLTECGGPTRIFRNSRGDGRTVYVAGLPRHARVTLTLTDEREVTRDVGGQTSYLCTGADVVAWSLAGGTPTSIDLWQPGSEPTGVALPATALEPGRYRARRTPAGWGLERE